LVTFAATKVTRAAKRRESSALVVPWLLPRRIRKTKRKRQPISSITTLINNQPTATANG
jgi:hypothetical protein